ncbi:MAG: serine/threonine protein kinase [Planctomycetota bacterium]|nr:MAG: serine/threonine protein kinase [Planctomycetota bacterium]
MRVNPGSIPDDQQNQWARPSGGGSRERALILAALNQIERASTWTTRQGSHPSSDVSPDAPTAAESSHPSIPREIPLPGPDIFPGYEIKREIHRGGQGVVYLAIQLATKRRVAIKVMHGGATLGSSGKARFDREVQLLGQLNHPNVVKLHDSGTTKDGSLFCVMDYVSGRSLDEILREQRREIRSTAARSRTRSREDGFADIETTLRFFAKVCDGVNAAHLKGVVHRDIKPANVRVDQSGEPVLVDFGLAKVAAGVDTDLDPSSPMTMTGQFIGSLPWASPEQAIGSADGIDLRTDVYSLGVMLYQMLTGGRFPYPVIGNMRDVLDNIQRAEPVRPSTIRRQINDEIETIILKALSKDRERRYQSAGELARDIRRYLAGEPIEAKRDSGWYVIRKTAKRHKVAVAVAAGFGIIITGSAIAMGGMWRQAEDARAVAVNERDRAKENLDAVRDMANTFLFDFHDSIRSLRGATRARGIILDKALEYLEFLAAQPNPDDELLLDLADAHDRVGELAGDLYRANTGTNVDAMFHYQQARDIRERLLEADPANTELKAKLAKSLSNIAESEFKNARYDEARGLFERAAALASEAGARRTQVAALARIGAVYLRLVEDATERTEEIDRLIDAAERATRTADEIWAASNEPDADRERAKLALRISQLRLIAGRLRLSDKQDIAEAESLFTESESLAKGAIATLGSLSAARPEDYDLARDHWVAVHHFGQSYSLLAKLYADMAKPELAENAHRRALAEFEKCVAIARGMTADPANIEALRDLVIALNKVGNEQMALGLLSEARSTYAESMDLCRQLYASDPIQRHLRDLGVGQFKLAQADERRADEAETPVERAALLELALAEYEEAQRLFETFTQMGGPGAGLVRVVAGEIERVRAQLSASGSGSSGD